MLTEEINNSRQMYVSQNCFIYYFILCKLITLVDFSCYCGVYTTSTVSFNILTIVLHNVNQFIVPGDSCQM